MEGNQLFLGFVFLNRKLGKIVDGLRYCSITSSTLSCSRVNTWLPSCLSVSTSSPAFSQLSILSCKSDLALTDSSSVLPYGSSVSLIDPGTFTGDCVKSMNSSI